jgi:membrane protease YdiL (CAAX protease family)
MQDLIKIICVILPFILESKFVNLMERVTENQFIQSFTFLSAQIVYLTYLFDIPIHFDLDFVSIKVIFIMMLVLLVYYIFMSILVGILIRYCPWLLEKKIENIKHKMKQAKNGLFYVCFIGPCLEEILFRYIFFMIFENSPWFNYFYFGTSCLLFSYLHCADNLDFIQFISTIISSFILNHYFLSFNLQYAILIHILNNLISMGISKLAKRTMKKT